MVQNIKESSCYLACIITSLLFVILFFWALTVDICVQQWTALSCWRSFWPSLSHVIWSIYWLDNVLAVSFCISFFEIIQMNNDTASTLILQFFLKSFLAKKVNGLTCKSCLDILDCLHLQRYGGLVSFFYTQCSCS